MAEQVKENETTVIENEETIENEEVNQEESALESTIQDLENRLQRTQADFENYKRRTRKEKEEFAKYASSKIMEALLPAYDNFDRAIETAKENKDFDSFYQGVGMIYRQIEQALTQEGLETIESVGQPFDPNLHQAVMQVETDEYESGIVVEEMQKGYRLKDKVLRPAMVKVNA